MPHKIRRSSTLEFLQCTLKAQKRRNNQLNFPLLENLVIWVSIIFSFDLPPIGEIPVCVSVQLSPAAVAAAVAERKRRSGG